MSIQDKLAFYSTALAGIFTLGGLIASIVTQNEVIIHVSIVIAVAMLVPLISVYSLLILKRINPKKYVFLSYAKTDENLASDLRTLLDKELNLNSRYRYEILIGDEIPLGTDMISGLKAIIDKTEVVILIVSEDYLASKWCISEFGCFDFDKQRVIPIAYSDLSLLSKLPKDISNIKGLRLDYLYTSEELKSLTKILSEDLIKNQS